MNNSIIKYYGDPSLSLLNTLMIHSIQGNTPLQRAQILCIGNTQKNPIQTTIRASIINEVIRAQVRDKNVFFLVQGCLLGSDLNDRQYTHIIGDNTIEAEHRTMGVDNQFILQIARNIRKTIYNLFHINNGIDQEYQDIEIKRTNVLHDIGNPIEEIFAHDDELANKLHDAFARKNKIIDALTLLSECLDICSRDTTFNLHQAIEAVRKHYPQVLVIVLGQMELFKEIPQQFHDVDHCILELQEYTSL